MLDICKKIVILKALNCKLIPSRTLSVSLGYHIYICNPILRSFPQEIVFSEIVYSVCEIHTLAELYTSAILTQADTPIKILDIIM